MNGIAHQEEPGTWAVQRFGAATLSDVRRVRRAVRIAEAIAAKPGGMTTSAAQRKRVGSTPAKNSDRPSASPVSHGPLYTKSPKPYRTRRQFG